MIFETERLIARPWTLDDAEYAFQMYGDPEVMRYLGSDGAASVIKSVDEMRERLGKSIQRYAGSKEGYVYAALESKELGYPIGTILLKPLADAKGDWIDDEIEIGWHLAKAHWGKGYGSEAATAVKDYGFQKLNLPELHAIAYPENAASLRIMQKIGMEYQGQTDRYYGVRTEHYLIRR